MSDWVTRAEVDERDRRLRAEIEQVRAAGERRDDVLERRMLTLESATLGMRDQLGDIHDALFGDPGRRSGPPSLYERLDRMDAEIKAEIAAVSRDVKRWRTYERVALAGVNVLAGLPLLRWLKAVLAWFLTLAGGVALGVVLSTFLTM